MLQFLSINKKQSQLTEVHETHRLRLKGAITSKIKHAIKLKTSPAQLLQRSLAFCFSLQPMTAHHPVHRHWLQAKTKY